MPNFCHSLISKFIFTLGFILLLTISVWAYFTTRYHKEKMIEGLVAGTDRITNTIRLGTHYAMMLNSRDDINQIINNVGKQKGIESIRIYNKKGEIKFSDKPEEVDAATDIKAEACYICHRTEPPLQEVSLDERTRIIYSEKGYRMLGVISPIYNEPGCSGGCHVHHEGKKLLGALDLVISMEDTDNNINVFEKGIILLALFIFTLTSAIIFIFLLRFVNKPIKELIKRTRIIAKGNLVGEVNFDRYDEIGQLGSAITEMGKEIFAKQVEMNRQKDEYQSLFELVPCYITVQDRDYKLINYNRQFADKFNPRPGDNCFYAYKGRSGKCENCPVEKTFEDGNSHYSEETGYNRDGTITHWMVVTSPLKNAEGEIAMVMEMCLDITYRKNLEKELKKSERKYHAIFNNIPNPVFVLETDILRILDCNDSIKSVYGYEREDLINRSFLDLFKDEEKDENAFKLVTSSVINRVRQLNKEGRIIFVNIRVSPSEYMGQKVLLITTSDITKRLETEQQLIQASKMATLGEMATGVAHELNQPLTVIKTASSLITKKVKRLVNDGDDTLLTLSEKINKNVDRASKIINHMRQFARKSDMKLQDVQVNTVIEKALEMFSQQLKLRGIDVILELEPDLPAITADPDRLEQVFVNLLINARDAVESKSEIRNPKSEDKQIVLKTIKAEKHIRIEVRDTGTGIPEAILDKIFEPFFTTKEVGKGTGLGLSISYGIVKDFGGNIWATSVPNQGACFIIEFPLQGK